jgi:hypothetical protein
MLGGNMITDLMFFVGFPDAQPAPGEKTSFKFLDLFDGELYFDQDEAMFNGRLTKDTVILSFFGKTIEESALNCARVFVDYITLSKNSESSDNFPRQYLEFKSGMKFPFSFKDSFSGELFFDRDENIFSGRLTRGNVILSFFGKTFKEAKKSCDLVFEDFKEYERAMAENRPVSASASLFLQEQSKKQRKKDNPHPPQMTRSRSV